MLTDRKWMETGQPFPPKGERERLERYEQNEQLFLGDHERVFGSGFARMESELRKRGVSRRAVFNYPQLLSKKTADFVCGEPPTLGLADGRGDDLRAALGAAGFDRLLYEAMMDVSRYGNAPIKVMEGRASMVAPSCWFPIVQPTDQKHITQHVIAFELCEEGEEQIYAEIHSPGRVEVRLYAADRSAADGGLRFGRLIEQEERQTGLSGCAVHVLTNITHSGSVFGLDDYGILRPLLERLMWRLSCIDGVLDRHSEPSLSGPGSALSYDERTGLYYLELGNYFKRDRTDDAPLEYLTWDGNLQSSFEEVELLIEQLYVLSEMGAAFMEGGGQGTAQSGTALKLRLVSPRVKSTRLAGLNTQTVRELAADIGRTQGIVAQPREISVSWHDGIPDDLDELSAILQRTTGGQPLQSQLSAIASWNGVQTEEAEGILQQIRAEQAGAERTYGQSKV